MPKWIISYVVALAFSIVPVLGQSITPQVGGGISSGFDGGISSAGNGTPSWVLPGATVDLDFANNRSFSCSFASCLSVTRASNATDLLPSSASGYVYSTYSSNVLTVSPSVGLLIFEARTNLLLNSTVPATQTTASLGTGTYTLWVNGSGSALASGGTATITGASSATNGAPNTITVTVAGTVTITVTGSLNFFQLEAGTFGTSGIVTAGTTATRAADNIQAAGNLATVLMSLSGGIVIQTSKLPAAWTSAFIGANSLNTFGRSTDTSFSSNGSTNLFGPVGTWPNPNKTGFSWATTPSRFLVINGGTVSTTTDSKATFAGAYFIGSSNGSTNYIDGIVSRLTVFTGILTQSQLQALTL